MKAIKKTPILLFVFIFFYFIDLETSEPLICIEANCKNTENIQCLQIFSERCSGSTYVTKLLKKNILTNNGKRLAKSPFGRKHFPPDFNLPISEWHGPREMYTFEQSENTVFLILFRNPYDWLQSLNRTPHHASRSLRKLPFSQFIRSPWKLDNEQITVQNNRKWNRLVDMNSSTESPHENPMKLRSAKIRLFLEIPKRVDNYYIVKYEKALNEPQKFIHEFCTIFNLKRADVYQPISTYKGLGKTHFTLRATLPFPLTI